MIPSSCFCMNIKSCSHCFCSKLEWINDLSIPSIQLYFQHIIQNSWGHFYIYERNFILSVESQKDINACQRCSIDNKFNPKKTGGPWWPPLNISREALAATLNDNFLSSFPHILTPNLWRLGVRFRSYVTLCTCTSDRKWLQNVILYTKSMQTEFFHLVHINMLIFTLNTWN